MRRESTNTEHSPLDQVWCRSPPSVIWLATNSRSDLTGSISNWAEVISLFWVDKSWCKLVMAINDGDGEESHEDWSHTGISEVSDATCIGGIRRLTLITNHSTFLPFHILCTEAGDNMPHRNDRAASMSSVSRGVGRNQLVPYQCIYSNSKCRFLRSFYRGQWCSFEPITSEASTEMLCSRTMSFKQFPMVLLSCSAVSCR